MRCCTNLRMVAFDSMLLVATFVGFITIFFLVLNRIYKYAATSADGIFLI